MKILFIVVGVIGFVFQCGLGAGMAQTPPPPVQGAPTVAAPQASSPPPVPPQPETNPKPPLPPGYGNTGGVSGQSAPPPPSPAREREASAAKAVASARNVKRFLKPGSVWIYQGPAGDRGVRAALIYQGRCLATLEFDPVTGDLFPEGNHIPRPGGLVSQDTLELIKRKLPVVVRELRCLAGAEYREPEAVWAVPLAFRGIIVARIKISRDGRRVIPDVPAEREMRLNAQ